MSHGKKKKRSVVVDKVAATTATSSPTHITLSDIATAESYSKPIDYLGGVMDEEVRPLLVEYVKNLGDGEGVLVVYRLKEGTDPSMLLEHHIKGIAEQDWQYVSEKKGNDADPLDQLVHKLSERANSLRAPIILFTQGEQKVKAEDEYRICFGIVGGPHSGPVTSIKGIVHQQLNMGLNGDLILNEAIVIFQALVDEDVFKEEDKDRPIHIKTYGAGGSTDKLMVPGVMAVSDGVIDIRTHIKPECVLSYLINYSGKYILDTYGAKHSETNDKKVKGFLWTKEFSNYYSARKEIEQKIKNHNYSGIEMVHDIGHLVNLLSIYVGRPAKEIMEEFSPEAKEYYGEVTFGTPFGGVETIYRMDKRLDGKPYFGNEGQKDLLNDLRERFSLMSMINDEESNIISFWTDKIKYDPKYFEKLIVDFVDTKEHRTVVQKCRAYFNNCNELSARILDFKHVHDLPVYKMELAKLQREFNEYIAPYNSYKKMMRDDMKIAFNELVSSINDKISSLESFLLYPDLKSADTKLRNEIEKHKRIHQRQEPNQEFNLTGCGAYFFTEKDKRAVAAYGGKSVEMENQLFAQMIHRSVVNQLYVDNQYITKLTADPSEIDPEVSHELNTWANTATMTMDEYVEAFIWARHGQRVDKVPNSGRWDVAETLTKAGHGNHFYTFGDNKIMNPFWKEIGTNFVEEICDGKAFKGKKIMETLNDTVAALVKKKIPDIGANQAEVNAAKHEAEAEINTKIKQLKALAQSVIKMSAEGVGDEVIKPKVWKLFFEYFRLTKLVVSDQVGDRPAQYRVYARTTMYLPDGYICKPVNDWDSSLYKSANTIMLADKAGHFLKKAGNKLGKTALIVSPDKGNNKSSHSLSPKSVLRALREAQSKEEYLKVLEIGQNFMDTTAKQLTTMKIDDSTAMTIEDERTFAYIKHIIDNAKESLDKAVAKIKKTNHRALTSDQPYSSVGDSDSAELCQLASEEGRFVKQMSAIVDNLAIGSELDPESVDKLDSISKKMTDVSGKLLHHIAKKSPADATSLIDTLSTLKEELRTYLSTLNGPMSRNIYRDESRHSIKHNRQDAKNLLHALIHVGSSRKLCQLIEKAKNHLQHHTKTDTKSTSKLKNIIEHGLDSVKASNHGFFKPIKTEGEGSLPRHHKKHGPR